MPHPDAPLGADIVVSALVLRDPGGRVLCVRKRGTSRFMLPGGKREAGETPLETALRETREELGVGLAPHEVDPLGEWFSEAANEPGLVLHSTVFEARRPLRATPAPAAEIDEVRWSTLDELARLDDVAPMLRGHVAPALRAQRASGASTTGYAAGAPRDELEGRHLLRYALFVAGLFVMALGVALTVHADLGTTPISTPPFVVSLGGVVTLGVASTVMNVVFVVLQIALLRRDFRWVQLLQVAVAVVFGAFIDAAMWLTSWFHPGAYWMQWAGVVVGSAVLAVGVTLQFVPKVLMNAGEGVVAALARVTGTKVGTMKIAFDVTLVAIGAAISLAMFGRFEGIREGTLVSMFLVGLIVGRTLPPSSRWFARRLRRAP